MTMLSSELTGSAQELGGRFSWQKTWQRTYLVSTGRLANTGSGSDAEADAEHNTQAIAHSNGGKPAGRSGRQAAAALAQRSGRGRKPATDVANGAANGGGHPARKRARRGAAEPDSAECGAAGAEARAAHGIFAEAGRTANGTGSEPACPADGYVGPANGRTASAVPRHQLLRRWPGCGRQRYLTLHGVYSDLLVTRAAAAGALGWLRAHSAWPRDGSSAAGRA
jgi:hypothetical protein